MRLHLLDCESETLRAIFGGGPADPLLVDIIQETFPQALYYAPCLRRLRGMVALICAVSKGLVLVQVPGPQSITQAFEGREPLSLRAIMVIILALEKIMAANAGSDDMRRLQEVLIKLYPEKRVAEAGAVVPSFYTIDNGLIDFWHKALRPDLDLRSFSTDLLSGAMKVERARDLLYHLREGFFWKENRERGAYKVTQKTARLIYDRLKAMADDEVLKGLASKERILACGQFPEFEKFAWPDASVGPRAGQVARALEPGLGNLI